MLVLKREEVTNRAQFEGGDAGYQWGGLTHIMCPRTHLLLTWMMQILRRTTLLVFGNSAAGPGK